MTDLGPEDLSLVTVEEAAGIAGVRPTTIRDWLRRYPDELHRHRSPDGRLLLSEREVLLCEAARHTSGRRRHT